MATIVQDFGVSSEKTLFSDSPEEDKSFARTFWQSVHLLPPMESRLVSSNIKQRMKVAPPGHQPSNVPNSEKEKSDDLTKSFLAKAESLQRVEDQNRLHKFSQLREEDLKLLAKRRQERMEKEKISDHKGISNQGTSENFTRCSGDGSGDMHEINQTLKDIEQFDTRLGLTSNDSDTEQ